MSAAPAFQFFAAEWLADSRAWTLAAKGAQVDLLA